MHSIILGCPILIVPSIFSNVYYNLQHTACCTQIQVVIIINRKLTLFYKIHNKLCPPYLLICLSPVTSDVNNYNLRNNQNYVPPRCRLRTSACSFIPSTVSLWNNLDILIRNSPTIYLFKNRVKGYIYKPPEYYNEGFRKLSTCILHTRLRHQCNSPNADLSRIRVINNY